MAVRGQDHSTPVRRPRAIDPGGPSVRRPRDHGPPRGDRWRRLPRLGGGRDLVLDSSADRLRRPASAGGVKQPDPLAPLAGLLPPGPPSTRRYAAGDVASPPRPILVASNRGPLSFSLDERGELVHRRGGGGLVTALAGVLQATGGRWVAAAMSDGDRVAARAS